MKINFPYIQELIELDKIFNIHNKDNLRIVGGAVRNFLLNKKITDYDLSCKYTPDEILDILNNNNIKALTIGKDFGTITAIINHKSFEITSTREDIQTDGRHAIVKYTNDFRIDAERRDFTFNALYLDFNNNLYDYFNGVEDLKNGIVRFIGNSEERIKEDYLRILRLFRFYSFYANRIEKDAFKYSIKYKNQLLYLSGERIKSEMFKIFKSRKVFEIIDIMIDQGIMQIITGIDKFNLLNFKELNIILNNILNNNPNSASNHIKPEIILAILLDNKNMIYMLKEKWNLSNIECSIIKNIIKYKNIDLNNSLEIQNILFDGIHKSILINILLYQSLISNNFTDIKKKISLIKSTVKPIFPITGNDLINIGINDKKQYSNILLGLKKEFILSNFLMTKDMLLSRAFVYFNKK